jgi:multiple sugar transport system permease protein
MSMNYLTRRRLLGRFLTVATFALVAVNLLPILWMVYCSLKDNNEILLGQVGIGHRKAQVQMIRATSEGILAGSRDGGLGLFQFREGKLKTLRSANRGWFSASFAVWDRELWAFSADKGLMELSPDWKVTRRWSMGDLKAAYHRELPGRPWNTVWVNDVYASYLVAKQDAVFGVLRMERGPGVVELTKKGGDPKFLNIANGLPFSIDELQDVPGTSRILMVGPNGLVVWDAATHAEVAHWEWGVALPWDRPSVVRSLDADEILFGHSGYADVFSISQGRIVRTQALAKGEGREIQSATVEGRTAWFGGVGGLWKMHAGSDSGSDSGDTALSSSRVRFDAVELFKIGDQVVAGGPDGEIAAFSAGSLDSLAAVRLPRGQFYVHWRNYIDLWRNLPFGTYLFNSVVVCSLVMVLSMVLASLAGYALARFRFRGKDTFGISILATQMIPGIMFLVPIYVLFTKVSQATGIRIVGTYWGLVALYSAFYVPFTIWILRGFFAVIPKELEEAALVDGCGPLRAFWSVILPAAMPGIVATGIYVFLTAWDELMFAWVLTNESTYTIPVGIRLFAGNYQNRYDLMMAAATVATLPVMILFFMMQRQIVSGLTAGAVKG